MSHDRSSRQSEATHSACEVLNPPLAAANLADHLCGAKCSRTQLSSPRLSLLYMRSANVVSGKTTKDPLRCISCSTSLLLIRMRRETLDRCIHSSSVCVRMLRCQYSACTFLACNKHVVLDRALGILALSDHCSFFIRMRFFQGCRVGM